MQLNYQIYPLQIFYITFKVLHLCLLLSLVLMKQVFFSTLDPFALVESGSLAPTVTGDKLGQTSVTASVQYHGVQVRYCTLPVQEYRNTTRPVCLHQLYMSACLWYLVKRDFYSARYCTKAFTSITFYKVPEQYGHVYLVRLYLYVS